MNINDTQDRIIREMAAIVDWMDKYDYLIEKAREMEPLEDRYKVEENAISGCQSSAWLHSEIADGRIHFKADSDTLITKGMIALVLQVLNHREPQAIVDAELYFIEKTGLGSHLSPSRANGLGAIVNQMRRLAEEAAPTSIQRAASSGRCNSKFPKAPMTRSGKRSKAF